MSDEKWIITGGCGFVGSNLVAALLGDGIDVVVLDSLVRVGSVANFEWLRSQAASAGAGRFVHVPADTRSATDIDDAFARHGQGTAVVAHLAGQVAMTTSIARPRYDFEVNVLGAINVLEAIRRHAPESLVMFSSTNKVYGDLSHVRHEEAETRWIAPDYPQGFDEGLPLSFESPYGCSKGAADQYFLDYHRVYGLRTVVFRHSSMYGGRQFATYDQGWIGWFCSEVLRQQAEAREGRAVVPFTVSGDGKQVRDLLHANDLVGCYRATAARPERCVGRAFNVGGGIESSLSLLELFAALERQTGHRAVFDHLPWRASDQKVFVANLRAITGATGWTPRIAKDEGLRRMLEWLSSIG